MAGQILGIGAASHQDGPFARPERLRNDLRVIPASGRAHRIEDRPSVGSHFRHRWLNSPFCASNCVTGSGLPPAADIRESPEPVVPANTMTSLVPQLPPVPIG